MSTENAPISSESSQNLEQTPKSDPNLEVKPPQVDEFSSKFAALSRREKQLLEKERKLKQYEEESNQKLSKASSWEQRIKSLKENPNELDNILSEAGLTFDQYLNKKLGIEEQEPQLSADEMYKKIKAEMEENFKKLQEEKEKAIEAENAQVIDNFQNEIKSFIKTNSDQYELINYQGDFGLVFEVVEEYYNQHGEVLSIKDAADHVEKHLEDLVDGATKLKKIASKFAPKTESSTKSESAPKIDAEIRESIKSASPTLSNDLNSQNSSYRTPVLDLEESKKRAAQLLRWT